MKARGFFVTGTDTGVGKTMVTAALALVAERAGRNVGVMKPVETGCDRRRDGSLVPRDAEFLADIIGQDEGDLVCPVRFEAPLAPLTAATLEHRRVSLPSIRMAYRRLASRYEIMFVEGAGGVAVPLTRNFVFSDLARELGLQAIVVARPALGTINHTVLTVEHLVARGVPVTGVIFSKATPGRTGAAARTSPDVIRALSGVRMLGTLGYVPRPSRSTILRAARGLDIGGLF